jgi:hypothetical protein
MAPPERSIGTAPADLKRQIRYHSLAVKLVP